ncbi:MAG: type II secretion system F family protein, partial [Desulfurococcales archaeon]|nr:type II secretion system F family protein [Desulfurococcales archaeon]
PITRVVWLVVQNPRLDPAKYGPRTAMQLLMARIFLYITSLTSLILPINLFLRLIILLSLIGMGAGIGKFYESILSSGLEDEVPSLILYLLPYSWSTYTIADLIVRLSDKASSGFKWLRHEACRLRLLLESGNDPLRALSLLAETTPSTSLKLLLEELVHASKIGYPRALVLSRLAERALEGVRRRWSSYAELAKVTAEVSAALMVALGALAPLSGFTGLNFNIISASVTAPALLSLLLVLMQPNAGPGRSPLTYRILPMAAIVGIALAAYSAGPIKALLVALPLTVVVEVAGVLHERKIKAGIDSLSKAAREARLGRPVEELLARAKPVDKPVIDAILDSTRIAGLSRAWAGMEFLERAYREALRTINSIRSSAFLVMAISLMASLTALYSASLLARIAASLTPESRVLALQVTRIIELLAPLTASSASILLRPRLPSLVPITVTLAGVAFFLVAVNSGLIPLS